MSLFASLNMFTCCFIIMVVRYMRTEALNNKYVYGAPIQGSRLVLDLADMHQVSYPHTL